MITYHSLQASSLPQIIEHGLKYYVSDIDLFDTTKKAIEDNKDQHALQDSAMQYWGALRPLSEFSIGDIRRTEIMIPNDLSAGHITIVNK